MFAESNRPTVNVKVAVRRANSSCVVIWGRSKRITESTAKFCFQSDKIHLEIWPVRVWLTIHAVLFPWKSKDTPHYSSCLVIFSRIQPHISTFCYCLMLVHQNITHLLWCYKFTFNVLHEYSTNSLGTAVITTRLFSRLQHSNTNCTDIEKCCLIMVPERPRHYTCITCPLLDTPNSDI